MKFLASTVGKVLAAALVIILVLGFLQLRSCQQARQQAAQSKVDRGQGEAFQNSAADAVNTQAGVNANSVASEGLTRSNERNIRNAQGSGDAVNPAVRDAGFSSLCKRPSFRNSDAGRVRCAPAR